MNPRFAKSLLASAAITVALAGCGGGGGSGDALSTPPVSPASPFTGGTVQSLIDYMNRLLAQTDETSEPQPVDGTPLPTDDTV